MKMLITRAKGAVWPVVLLAGVQTWPTGRGLAQNGPQPAAEAFSYASPSMLMGDILTLDGASRQVLFRFRRAATESGPTVNVSREYSYPDGRVAVRSQLRYEGDRLVWLETEKLQNGEKGEAVIRWDPKNPARGRIFFEHTLGQGKGARKSTASEMLGANTLADDMIAGFIGSHWEELQRGETVKFRYIALSRKETVGFKLMRDAETQWQGTPALRVRMEPTSFLVAQMVEPMFFIVEQSAPHRVFEFIGRTLPLVKDGTKWKDLDADTVFQWEPAATTARTRPRTPQQG